MKSQPFTSVWDAIEDSPELAENMKMRSTLMIALKSTVTRNNWSQAHAANRMGVTQPRISDLMRGKINLFALDSLIAMASNSGMRVELRITETAPA